MAPAILPQELIDTIIDYAPPQSFESLALTCKRNYARCKPFIKRHNQLRRCLRNLFLNWERRGILRLRLFASSDLILLIAAEPLAARYVRKADLHLDSCDFMRAQAFLGPPPVLPSIEEGGSIVRLFAHSTYLRQAGLDWTEYYSTFKEDVREERYSQNGAAFLLTLLPDVEELILPKAWKPNLATNKLLDVLVERAKQSKHGMSSLSVLTKFEAIMSTNDTGRSGMRWASPFLALPHMQTFSTSQCTVMGNMPESLAFGTSPYMADTLNVADLGGSRIDQIGIADFLRHAPRLRSLRYFHPMEDDTGTIPWDICKFVNTVAREAGDRLVEFSIDGSLPMLRGTTSTRRFKKLEKFEFPLELVLCNIGAAGSTTYVATSLQRFFFGPVARDLIPPSVIELSLTSAGTEPYARALDALFGHFRAVHKTQLPALRKVSIQGPPFGVDPKKCVYLQRINKTFAEAEKEGIECIMTSQGTS